MHDLTDHQFPGDELNDMIIVTADDRDPNNGNASHCYNLSYGSMDCGFINFQHGPRNKEGSLPGVTDAAVLAILLDRYRGFQEGPFACRENALVITKLEEALHWMQNRTLKRLQQGVLGKNENHT